LRQARQIRQDLGRPNTINGMETRDATVTKAVLAVWSRIQKELGVPDIEVFLTNDHSSGCASADWDHKPLAIRLNLREPGPGQLLPLDDQPRLAM
jgi:hypothetical protein